MTTPEDLARQEIDRLLTQAGWVVCNPDDANILAHHGVAIRAVPLKSGHGYADYLLYVDGRAAGVIEAKAHGTTLSGVEVQSAKGVELGVREYVLISWGGRVHGCPKH